MTNLLLPPVPSKHENKGDAFSRSVSIRIPLEPLNDKAPNVCGCLHHTLSYDMAFMLIIGITS